MGCDKCNIDGAWAKQRGLGGVGMVVRNEYGEFIAAALKNHCRIASPLLAEFVVARDAALSMQELKLMAVEMEGEALLVMVALQRAEEVPSWAYYYGHTQGDEIHTMDGDLF
ncbi:hypothetical protein FF1_034898 [Malus domestica]